MSDGLNHLSRKTRERAYVLSRNAKSLGIPLGAPRFTPDNDYVSYWFTNGKNYVVIFCTPSCYLAELHMDDDGSLQTLYFAILNIRRLLQYLKPREYKDVDFSWDMEDNLGGETDLRSYLEGLEDEE